MSPPASEGGDVRDGLRELSRDVAETHALVNRTHNSFTTLAASLQALVKRHEQLERRLNLNSFIAYLVFTVLLGGAFYLLYTSRADALVRERDEAHRARADAAAQSAAIKADLDARDAASRKAQDYWALLADGSSSANREQALQTYPEIARERLTPVEAQVFKEGVEKARQALVAEALAAGQEAARAQQWKRSATQIQRALTWEPEGPRAGQMRYHLGVALHKQGDYAEAARHLEAALAANVEKTTGPDVRFYLASALEALRQLERARDEYQKFADNNWLHPWSKAARRRVRDIRLQLKATQ